MRFFDTLKTESSTLSRDDMATGAQYVVPAQMEKHLDGLQFWNDGTLLVASSNLTGRYWLSSVWAFPVADQAPNVNHCLTGFELEAGISDMVALDKNRLLLGLDTGTVELLELTNDHEAQNGSAFISVAYWTEHDDGVTNLSMCCTQTQAISASIDKSVKIWDLETFSCSSTYRTAHTDAVLSVSAHYTDPYVFLTASQDGNVKQWDTRIPKPAALIDVSMLEGNPSCIAYQPGQMHSFAVGSKCGEVAALDTRSALLGTDTSRRCRPIHKRPIHRLVFSPSKYDWLATCSDDSSVIVVDVSREKPSLLYESDAHEDFVRGVAWHPITNRLYSVGWDAKVKGHAMADASEFISNELANGDADVEDM